MTNDELKQLVESNARTIQAMLDAMVDERQERQELREGVLRLENVVTRLTNLQEGNTNLLASLDEDRPTVLRRLASLETKVDRLLERQQNRNDS